MRLIDLTSAIEDMDEDVVLEACEQVARLVLRETDETVLTSAPQSRAKTIAADVNISRRAWLITDEDGAAVGIYALGQLIDMSDGLHTDHWAVLSRKARLKLSDLYSADPETVETYPVWSRALPSDSLTAMPRFTARLAGNPAGLSLRGPRRRDRHV